MNIDDLKRLAGINPSNIAHQDYDPYFIRKEIEAIKKEEVELGCKPGDREWFDLWFGTPKNAPSGYLLRYAPKGFRGLRGQR